MCLLLCFLSFKQSELIVFSILVPFQRLLLAMMYLTLPMDSRSEAMVKARRGWIGSRDAAGLLDGKMFVWQCHLSRLCVVTSKLARDDQFDPFISILPTKWRANEQLGRGWAPTRYKTSYLSIFGYTGTFILMPKKEKRHRFVRSL